MTRVVTAAAIEEQRHIIRAEMTRLVAELHSATLDLVICETRLAILRGNPAQRNHAIAG